MYIEVFTYQQFNQCRTIGFKNIMLNIRTGKELNNILNIKYNSISAITIGPEIFYSYRSLLQKIFKRNIKIYAFLINNISDIKMALCNYITGFYID